MHHIPFALGGGEECLLVGRKNHLDKRGGGRKLVDKGGVRGGGGESGGGGKDR